METQNEMTSQMAGQDTTAMGRFSDVVRRGFTSPRNVGYVSYPRIIAVFIHESSKSRLE